MLRERLIGLVLIEDEEVEKEPPAKKTTLMKRKTGATSLKDTWRNPTQNPTRKKTRKSSGTRCTKLSRTPLPVSRMKFTILW